MVEPICWPTNLNVLRGDLLDTNCVICMAALNGSIYLVQVTTNLNAPINRSNVTNVTSLVNGTTLVVTNQRIAPLQYYRVKISP